MARVYSAQRMPMRRLTPPAMGAVAEGPPEDPTLWQPSTLAPCVELHESQQTTPSEDEEEETLEGAGG